MHQLFTEELPYDPNQVTPGVIGFAVTALVAIVVMLLMWDFNRRVRRINDREEARERLQAEMAESQRGQAAAVEGSEDADGGRAPAAVEPLEADGDGAGPAR
ncbi:hypothetical protein [Agrococcus baldri]|uniref:Uncharacterized protein n=1 Tax=Agrococcus baldri TaxID=153730 RepID=A0AA87RGK6_9MICO|nr:hypothetical protein [Agrococcus baldri]GEK80066.1 hypothetical protein ABA31_14170 [Agrococcus baldri]